MGTYRIPLLTGDCDVKLPDSWTARTFGIDRPGLTREQMRQAFANPIGTPRFRDIARGKHTAAIIIDDTSRPTRAHHFMSLLLEELYSAGIKDDDIVIVAGRGTHRHMTGPDFRIKLGDDVVDRIKVMNHSLYEHLVFMGTTSNGTPVHICREVAQADVRIAIGGIIPHPGAGYGGGAKVVLPGVSGVESIAYNHTRKFPKPIIGQADNPFRRDLEEVARLAGIDAIVNPVINGRMEPVGLFVGDVVEAHRAGCKLGDEVYFLDGAPSEVDAAIISAYPMDREFDQSIKALAPGAGIDSVRDDGTVLFMSGGVDGAGFQGLNYKLNRLVGVKERTRQQLGNRKVLIYSPGVGPCECYTRMPDDVKLFRDLDQAVNAFVSMHDRATVNIFPHGGISLLKKA